MKTRLLPCTLACMLMTAMPGFSGPEDDFYEANLTLTRAGRLEKEGDFKGALESSEKAARLLQALKQSSPDWNPSWIASKLENASQIRERVELLAQKAPEPKKEDHSLKPGEWRDVTFERAYKAHEQQQLAVRQVPPPRWQPRFPCLLPRHPNGSLPPAGVRRCASSSRRHPSFPDALRNLPGCLRRGRTTAAASASAVEGGRLGNKLLLHVERDRDEGAVTFAFKKSLTVAASLTCRLSAYLHLPFHERRPWFSWMDASPVPGKRSASPLKRAFPCDKKRAVSLAGDGS